MHTNITSGATAPATYGYGRGCIVTAIAPLIERQLQFLMGINGGHDDDQGRHWVWKSARELRDWLATYHGIVTSVPTVSRALEAIASSGRWVREQLGVMRRAYYYRPADQLADKCIDQPGEMHSSMVMNPADSTGSERTAHPDRFAAPEPSDPCPAPGHPPRERPVRRGDRPDPTLYQSQGGQLFQRPEWITHQGVPEHEIFTRIDPQQPQERPEPAMPDESRTEPLRLDSRPTDSPVELEAGSVTDQNSASPALNALNTAKVRGWIWDAVVGLFRHKVLQRRRSVAEMAGFYGVSEQDLQLAIATTG